MNVGNVFTLTCGKCGRKQQLAASLIAKRRTCAYCGGTYTVPAEAEAQIKAMQAPAALNAKPMTITCAVCFHPIRYPAVTPGLAMSCRFCSSPFVAPEQDGVAHEADPTFAVSVAPIKILCPSCLKLVPVPGNTTATPAPCPDCGKAVEWSQTPIESLLGVVIPSTTSRLSALARAALLRRWVARRLTIAEAAEILIPLSIAETWTPPDDAPEVPVSPLSPALTAELVKYSVFSIPDAVIGMTEGEGTRLMIKLHQQGGFPWDSLMQGKVKEAIQASLTPMSAFRLPSKDKPESIQPLFYLTFRAGAAGSVVTGQVQRPEGPMVDLNPWEFAPVRAVIRQKIVGTLYPYLAFRSLFGMWATIQIQQSANADAVVQKIREVGGDFKPEAAALGKAVLGR